MVVLAPQRSLEQRMSALQEANRIRVYRAQLKRDLKAGRASIIRLLQDPPAEIHTMKVFDLLLAQPKLGRKKVLNIFKWTGISPSKTIDGITGRQLGELLCVLRELPQMRHADHR